MKPEDLKFKGEASIIIYIYKFISIVISFLMSIVNTKRASVSMMQHRVLLPFYSKNWRRTGKTSIYKMQVRQLIESWYFLIRITLNRLKEIGNRAGVFPFAFLVWCFLIVVDRQSLNNQELITVILTYGWRKITVLPRISPVVTDMTKPTMLFLTRHIKTVALVSMFLFRFFLYLIACRWL